MGKGEDSMTARDETTEADAIRIGCPVCGVGPREACTIPGTSVERWAHLERVELATQTKGAGDGEGTAGSSSLLAFARRQLEDEALQGLTSLFASHHRVAGVGETTCTCRDWSGIFHGRHLASVVTEWLRANPELAGALTEAADTSW